MISGIIKFNINILSCANLIFGSWTIALGKHSFKLIYQVGRQWGHFNGGNVSLPGSAQDQESFLFKTIHKFLSKTNLIIN